jgi:hypothetical protein
MFRDSSSSPTTLSGMPLPRFFTSSRKQRSSGSVKVWKLTPSFPSRECNELTAARNPSAVDGTTINFSPFTWVVKPLGQDARNQARKALVSPTPEIKMGVLLGRSPAVAQVVATLALKVVPAGVPLRGPDMSWDMRLVAFSVETADSDGSESMAVGLSVPLG